MVGRPGGTAVVHLECRTTIIVPLTKHICTSWVVRHKVFCEIDEKWETEKTETKVNAYTERPFIGVDVRYSVHCA